MRIVIAAIAALALAAPAAAESYTTRIEPRPFYGATVTIEEGVRVFRPLPTQRHVIINPGGQTPLNLSYNDTRVTEHSTSTNHNYNYDSGAGGGYYGGSFGGYGFGGFGGHGKAGFNRGGGVGGKPAGAFKRHYGGHKGHN